MVGSRLNVHLYRDSFNTPWGFRLQGGKDLNQPLVVQRVFSNSPAEGELSRGDVILSINNRDGSTLTHKQAQDCIKHGGGQVELVISRPPPGTHVAPLSPPAQTPRAPTFKLFPSLGDKFKAGLNDEDTPVSAEYVKKRLDYLRLLAKQQQHQPTRRTATMNGHDMDGAQETRYEHQEKLATGPIPKVCSRNQLGGGGYTMGQGFGGSATLPRRNTGRQLSHPPSMPAGGNPGFTPTRVPINKLGGGGPTFGSDFSHVQPQQPQRVQGTLENISLSPRTPEVNMASPFYQPYEQPQQAPHYQAPQYQAPQYQAPQAPQYQAPAPAEQMFTPTGMLLEHQRAEEQQEVKVAASKPIPKVLKPQAGQSSYADFGIDYSKKGFNVAPAPVNQQPTYFRPAPAQSYTPAPAPAPAPVYAPAPAPVHHIPVQSSTQSWQKPPQVEDNGVPAWSNTLRSTGVKPWEKDLYMMNEQEAQRSVPYTPIPVQNHHAAPAHAHAGGDAPQEGPKVVHLQYNSPMQLYSKENVQETLRGQTQVLADQTKVKDEGERDWSQSSVLRLIEQDNKSSPRRAPHPAPKPQIHQIQLQQQPCYDEIGASDF